MAVTKKKTAPFKGAWMNPRIPEPEIRAEIVAHGGLSEECVVRVLAVLRRQVEVWRFDLQRRASDPEPGQWRSILHAIVIPERMDFFAFDDVRRKVNALPAKVLGVLNTVLFDRAEVGTVALFERMWEATTPCGGVADPADGAILRDVLADMIEGLRDVTGKRGPHHDVGPALRAVHRAIVENSTMGDVAARTLAADLLNKCGYSAPKSVPTSRSRLAQIFAEADPD